VGHPVRFDPKYVPPSGTEVDVIVLWVDKDGKRQKAPAQKWIRQVRTGKPMPYKWVFAGSGFWVDEETGERHYQAEDGDLICVSNFATATLDIPVESSTSNDALLFEAFTENIPPLGTTVRLVLIPKVERKKADPAADEAPDPDKTPPPDAAAPPAEADAGPSGPAG
jgi:hypothetical protein